jgi:Protein of unknown function (DUF3822)
MYFSQGFVVLLRSANMIRPDFHIQNQDPSAEDPSQCRLLIEVGECSLTYVLLNVRGMRPAVIKCFQWQTDKAGPTEEVVREIIEEDGMLSKFPANEIFIVYHFAESNLVPVHFYSAAAARPMTDLVYGDLSRDLLLDEKVPWWEIHNLYRVPVPLYAVMQEKFFNAKHWHYYSLQLKCYKMFTSREESQFMKVSFYTDCVVAMLCRAGQLQLIQTFDYRDSKDVLYNLLNCCRQLGFDREEVEVELSGLIEKQSALFQDLHQYFLRIRFESMEDSIKFTDELMEYPPHFFSSLLKMAICV